MSNEPVGIHHDVNAENKNPSDQKQNNDAKSEINKEKDSHEELVNKPVTDKDINEEKLTHGLD